MALAEWKVRLISAKVEVEAELCTNELRQHGEGIFISNFCKTFMLGFLNHC